MKDEMIRCVRCKGRKKLFKVGNIYSYTNTGGVEVNCPMCLGEGQTKSLEHAIEDAKKVNIKNNTDKTKGRDFQHVEKPIEKSEPV